MVLVSLSIEGRAAHQNILLKKEIIARTSSPLASQMTMTYFLSHTFFKLNF